MRLKLDLPDNWLTPDGSEPPEPPKRKPRLTIKVEPWAGTEWRGLVFLDDVIWCHVSYCNTEPEARAAAQAYVDELIKHFQGGGR